MLGPPGSGKGTQGSRLAVRYGVPHLSSGELLRTHVRNGTAVGRAAGEAMSRGELVADDFVVTIVREEVLGPERHRRVRARRLPTDGPSSGRRL